MTPHPDDTIVALSSAPGPGGRAVIRLSGSRTLEFVRTLCPDLAASAGFLPANVRLSGLHTLLPGFVQFRTGPNTYTGQDLAELHTISSSPLIERLIADLLAAGARSAERGEFTLRAFLAGKKDLTQAEAVLAVLDARTPRDLGDSLAQLAGGVTQPLQLLRGDLLDLLADVEAGLDFVGEDIEFVSADAVMLRVTRGIAHLTNLRRQLDGRSASTGTLRVLLVGPPNAGKSSLFNALVGTSTAIVSPIPGTTRDYLSAIISMAGIQVELIDTAGEEIPRDAIEAQAQHLSIAQRDAADLILDCQPADATTVHRPDGTEILRLATKCDLAQFDAVDQRIPVSVVTPHGLDQLHAALATVMIRLATPPLAPSQSRCRSHIERALEALQRAHEHARESDPQELLALALREALDEVAAMTGAVHTDDLLDRVFSRFCIGK